MQGTLVATAMRNEGPFILEWIAWQKMLGFEDILVLFNDCTDHSPQLLRLLERAGMLTAKKHVPPPGVLPQIAAFRALRRHPLVAKTDWLLICDVDEYLVIHKGAGTLGDLLPTGAPAFTGMCLNWLIFGNNNVETWQDGFVRPQFTRAAREKARQNNCVKSFIYQPMRFKRFGSHMPRDWTGDGDWNQGTNHWVLSDGRKFSEYDPDENHMNGTPTDLITHKVAQLNHYIIQSDEQYDFKAGLVRAGGGHDRYKGDFFARFNHNTVEDSSALKHEAAFAAEYDKLTAIPGILRLHHLCCADFATALCEKRGGDVEADARVLHHRKMASELPRH